MKKEKLIKSKRNIFPQSLSCLVIAILVIGAVLVTACGQAVNESQANSTEYADNPIAERETMTQISTIDALLNGVYDGVITYEVLKGYGDFGIGTFQALDGEMLAFDGEFYQVKADGVAYPVADSQETPFAMVTFFDIDYTGELAQGLDYTSLQEYLDSILPSINTFCAIKIEGTFSYMKTRSVPAQQKPYPPLVEVTKNQPIFEFEEVEGTMVGFRSPPFITGLNMPGYHLHFLTNSKDAGGHVLEFTIGHAEVFIDYTPDFMMILPGMGSDFYQIDLTPDNQDELEQAEK
ncbi:MAG: acetolactate decarboxylase [Dehalococcoidales bacterium]|nr:acetolactate decarboxylase [Dehalococcoidales bacterium]